MLQLCLDLLPFRNITKVSNNNPLATWQAVGYLLRRKDMANPIRSSKQYFTFHWATAGEDAIIMGVING